MLKISDWKVVFAAVGFAGVLLFASPALSMALRFPSGERFSELWLLGPGHMTQDYPFNVAEEESLVFLGVGNHMGSSVFYDVQVKLRNQTDDLPNSTVAVLSLLPLYTCHVFLKDGQSWEQPLNFSFSQVSAAQNRSMIGGLRVNDAKLSVDKSAELNLENRGYFYELFMELWIYNVTVDEFQYHNRFVGIWLNMSVAS